MVWNNLLFARYTKRIYLVYDLRFHLSYRSETFPYKRFLWVFLNRRNIIKWHFTDIRAKIQFKTIRNLFPVRTTLLNKCIDNFNSSCFYFSVSKIIECNILKYQNLILKIIYVQIILFKNNIIMQNIFLNCFVRVKLKCTRKNSTYV